MEKQTKNVITRKTVEKELYLRNKADIRSPLVMCGILLLIFAPLTIGIIALIQNIYMKILVAFLLGSAPVVAFLLQLFVLRISYKERMLLHNGDFEITVHKVQYKDEKLVNYFGSARAQKYLHFGGFKKIAVENANYDLTAQGDAFYLVHYKGSAEIKLLYPLRAYTIKQI